MNDSPAGSPADPPAVPSNAVDQPLQPAPAAPAAEPVPEPLPEPVPEFAPAAPAPLDVPRTPTGHPDVDAQLERLADVDHLPSDGHLEVYEDVHEGLRTTLSALDAGEHAPSHRPPHDHRS